MTSVQLSLFDHVASCYAESGHRSLSNDDLYVRVAEKAGVSKDDLSHKTPIGKQGVARSLVTRKIRWFQQTLKKLFRTIKWLHFAKARAAPLHKNFAT